MEKYKNLTKGTKVGLVISLFLVLLGIAYSIYTLVVGFGSRPVGIQCHIGVVAIEYVLIAVYALHGYRKPHGNMLKYTMLAFTVLSVYKFFVPGKPVTENVEYIANACIVLAAIMIAYISGRLNKINKNKILMIVVEVLFIVSIVLMRLTQKAFSIDSFIRSLSMPICWVALCFAYVARFEEHKAAGLADKADVEEK